MVVLGADTHKRNHTVVAADEAGVELGSITVGATPEGHLRLVKWAARWPERRWALEDCRQLSTTVPPSRSRPVETRGTGGAGATENDGRCPSFREDERQVGSYRRVGGGSGGTTGTGPSRRPIGWSVSGTAVVGRLPRVPGQRPNSSPKQVAMAAPRTRTGLRPGSRVVEPIQDPRRDRPAPCCPHLNGGRFGETRSGQDPRVDSRSQPTRT